jgi:hypothetical protein
VYIYIIIYYYCILLLLYILSYIGAFIPWQRLFSVTNAFLMERRCFKFYKKNAYSQNLTQNNFLFSSTAGLVWKISSFILILGLQKNIKSQEKNVRNFSGELTACTEEFSGELISCKCFQSVTIKRNWCQINAFAKRPESVVISTEFCVTEFQNPPLSSNICVKLLCRKGAL